MIVPSFSLTTSFSQYQKMPKTVDKPCLIPVFTRFTNNQEVLVATSARSQLTPWFVPMRYGLELYLARALK